MATQPRSAIGLCAPGLALTLAFGCANEADGPPPGASAGSAGSAASSAGDGSAGDDSGATGGADDGGSDSGAGETTAGANPDADADFAARCGAPGVLVCRGFDDVSELAPSCCESETGASPDSAGTMDYLTIDPAARTSGAGALRFEIVGQTAANHSGGFRQLFGQAFGPGTEFYVQYRLRITPEFLLLPESPKFAIFHHSSATCNDVEWTHYMADWYGDTTGTYTHCGQYTPGGAGTERNLQEGDYLCPYGSDYLNDPNCLKFATDTWMTFYFKGAIGDWGTPTSHLEAWYAVDGGGYEQWVDDPAFTLYAEGESMPGFDSVFLTTYITGKDSAIDHATAYAWFDELIVSSEPIAVPQY